MFLFRKDWVKTMEMLNIAIHWDEEAQVWLATNEKIGLILESGSYDALIERIKSAVPELIELNNLGKDATVTLCTANREVVMM